MRTTINLPDGLAEAARARAVSEGRTFTSIVEEGLRAVLASPRPEAVPVTLPAFGDSHQRPLVDLEDTDALWRALDADGPR